MKKSTEMTNHPRGNHGSGPVQMINPHARAKRNPGMSPVNSKKTNPGKPM